MVKLFLHVCHIIIPSDLPVRRLGIPKIRLINFQRERITVNDSESEALVNLLIRKKLYQPENIKSRIVWNRFSLLDRSGDVRNLMKELDVEADTFNWKVPLHIRYKKNKRVIAKTDFSNTLIASNYMLNIPVWSTYFQELENNENKNN